MLWNAPSIGAARMLFLAFAMLLILATPASAAPDPSYEVTPDPPVAGQPATFTSTSTSTTGTDPSVPVAIRGVRWDFVGDDSFEQAGDVVTHTYVRPGIKTFRMRVVDVLGVVTIESFTLTVSGPPLPVPTPPPPLPVPAPPPANRLPVAQFSTSDLQPEVGDQILLRSFSYDPDGSIVALRWDLDGDGDFDENVSGATAFTTFLRPGPKTLRLRVEDSSGASHTETVNITVKRRPASRPTLMYPFPVIRLAGSVTATGARVRTLEVGAPRRSQITVRCAGKSCPAKRFATTSSTLRVRFKRMARFLRAGTVITVAVRKGNMIGKHTRWLVRAGKLPKRTDLCLYPQRAKPARCPLALE